jgi:hypothetical protein
MVISIHHKNLQTIVVFLLRSSQMDERGLHFCLDRSLIMRALSKVGQEAKASQRSKKIILKGFRKKH